MSKAGHHYLPSIIEHETLYSWCGAVHRFSSKGSATQTAASLLGGIHRIRYHVIPVTLQSFPPAQGLPPLQQLALILHHTVAGYYWPFLTDRSRLSLTSVPFGPSGEFHRKLALSQSRSVPISHPLKFCESCIEADIKEWGRCVWHVVHQYPTTYFCDKHSQKLQVHPGHSKRWCYPDDAPSAFVDRSTPSDFDRILSGLGRLIAQGSPVNVGALRRFCHSRLRSIGVVQSLQRVSHQGLISWFVNGPSSTWEVSSRLPALADGKWLPALLWRQKQSHPVKWLLLWASLGWGSAQEAFHAFVHANAGRDVHLDGQVSLFEPARLENFVAPAFVIEAFEKHDSYADVMRALGAGRSVVLNWLESDPHLRQTWRNRLRRQKQANIELAIRESLAIHPGIDVQALASIHGSQLLWLRANAPAGYRKLLVGVPQKNLKQLMLFD